MPSTDEINEAFSLIKLTTDASFNALATLKKLDENVDHNFYFRHTKKSVRKTKKSVRKTKKSL